MTTKAEAWKKRVTNKKFRDNHDATFKEESLRCPNCNAMVSKDSKECWVCKKELNNG